MNELIINPRTDLVFDLKVVEQCKNCKRYGKVSTCPPKVSDSSYYEKLLTRYDKGVIYYEKFEINEQSNWMELGRLSSKVLANTVLNKRNELVLAGNYFCIAFGGGSCKQCTVCSFPCAAPDRALIPIEATGINVVEIMKKFGVEIKYPVKDFFYRVGFIFYDEVRSTRKIIYTAGTWDLFHHGHLHIMKKSKELGDWLIVGVSTDEVVKSYKGIVPVIPYQERKEIIESLKFVDQVVKQEKLLDVEQMKELKVDILTIGDDWKGKDLEGLRWAEENHKLVYFPYTKGISSTLIKKKIKSNA